jgi:hypothetical protein
VEWIAKVWKPWTLTKIGPTIMILDEMSAHMTAEVRSAISSCGTTLHLIPGGYTSKLQVMDVGFNKSFKSHYRDLYDEWFMQAPNGVKPKREDVSVWISECWNRIPNTVAHNTWRKIGLPNPAAEVAEGAGEVEDDPEEENDNSDFEEFMGEQIDENIDTGSEDNAGSDNEATTTPEAITTTI